jgi:hypothetical protein
MENNKVKEMSDNTQKEDKMRPNESQSLQIRGHIKIFDPETKEVYIDKTNAIHYENMSVALANSLSNQGYGMIEGMAFGNGGTEVDPSGIITYLTPNNVGSNSSLYNQTYYKVIDANNTNDSDPSRNFMEVRHTRGTAYSDVFCSVLLDYGEPNNQQAYDNSSLVKDTFAFDEIGLRAASVDGTLGSGQLLTHVIFHPVLKSLNRLIQIDYTIRIQTLSS